MKIKRMFAANKNASELEILLYDQIGRDFWGEGMGAKDLAEQLKAAGDVSRIVLRINSPGGDVFDGMAMFNLLAAQKAPVDVIVDGLAASAASVIAMVGRTITMGESAMMMIHNPWSFSIGDANDMRKMADTLDKVRDSMVTSYMKRYTGTEDELKAKLDAETWLSAADCKEIGFCDEISVPEKADKDKAAALAASFDLSKFKNTPEKLKVAPEPEEAAIAASADLSNYHRRNRLAELA